MSRSVNRQWIHGKSSSLSRKRRIVRRPFAELLERRDLLANVVSVDPRAYSHTAPTSTNVAATFDENVNAATATPQSFRVHSTQRGQLVGTAAAVSTAGTTVTLDPTVDFFPGEIVKVTATSAIQGATAVVPRVWDFRTGVAASSAEFRDSGQTSLGNTYKNRLGDLDADGDLDAFVLLGDGSSAIMMNDGSGAFTTSQSLGNFTSYDARLGDLDGDGDLDAIATGEIYFNDRIWLNNGSGQFNPGQVLGNHASLSVDLGDLDGDGDLDAYIGTRQDNRVLLNDGNANFTDTGQNVGRNPARRVVMGDVDQDGDLDLLSGQPDNPDSIFLNNGNAVFTDSGQLLGTYNSSAVLFGDVDSDGDPDLVIAHSEYGANHVWLNNGSGVFTDSGQRLGDHSTLGLGLGDLDGDGDLDFIGGSFYQDNRLWLNDGNGVFSDSGRTVGMNTRNIELGDLDGDGDLDAFAGHQYDSSQIFLNESLTPSVMLSVDNTSVPENGGMATVTAALSAAHTNPVTIDLGISGTATATNDYTVSGTQIAIAVGATTGSVTVTALQDTVDEPDETVVVDITAVTNGQEAGAQQVTTTILDDDEPPLQVVAVTPDPNAHLVPASTDVTVTFEQDVNPTTVTPQTFAVHSMQRGQLVGPAATVSAAGATVTLDPTLDLFPGELVQATVTSAIRGTGGQVAVPQTWQFRAAVTSGSGEFLGVGQGLGDHRSRGVELGDLDGDGDLDAFVVNVGDQPNRIWLNEGGQFSDSGQLLGDHASRSIALGDLDGDGDLDAFVGNRFQGNRVWINEGGQFSDTGQSLGDHDSYGVALGDVDGDGDLDVFVANLSAANRVWINEGGVFSSNGQSLGDHNSENVSLGDLDGDGDLDAFVGNSHQGNRVWLNNEGVFSDSGQSLADHDSCGAALGDLDGDGDLDAFVTNSFQGNRVWLNDGTSVLVDTGQTLGDHDSWGTALGDLDGDGDLDAFVADFREGNHVWLNDGGVFSDSGLSLGDHQSFGVALGDLDGDGDLDAIVANRDQGNRVWLNDDAQSLRVTSLAATNSGFTAQFSSDFDATVLNLYDTQAAALGAADVLLQGATTGQVTGSLVVDAASRLVSFIKTGDPLQADTYTVTLRSATDGFKEISGTLLDGNGDGTVGDSFSDTFTVVELPVSPVMVSLPDLVRGPGQGVNLPADATTGIPLTISDGANVRNVEVHINYNPALLVITAATVGIDMPTGATVALNFGVVPGLAIVTFSSPSDLPAGSATIVNLQAIVPSTDASGIYGKQQVVDLDSVTITDANANPIAASADDAIHLVSYFGDTSGNGRINASDAAQVARFAALIDSGFASSLNTDPTVIGDISGNGRINAADAARVAQFAALIDVPEIPPIPGGVVVAGLRVLDLGPGLPGVVTDPNAPAETNGNRPQHASAPVHWGLPPQADLGSPLDPSHDAVMAAQDDEEQLHLALEAAIDELLSAGFPSGYTSDE